MVAAAAAAADTEAGQGGPLGAHAVFRQAAAAGAGIAQGGRLGDPAGCHRPLLRQLLLLLAPRQGSHPGPPVRTAPLR